MRFECKYSNKAVPGERDLLSVHVDLSETLEELIFNWLNDFRTVVCLGGTDDDKNGEPSCFILFESLGEEIGHVNVSYRVLENAFPDAFVIEERSDQQYPLPSKEWNQLLGMELLSKADSMKLCASFILSDNAEVIFNPLGREFTEQLDQFELGDFLGSNSLFSVRALYRNRETLNGFGTSFVVLHTERILVIEY
jgi:hypothetical protein